MKKTPNLSIDERRIILSCLKDPFQINVASLFYDWPDCDAPKRTSFEVAAKRWYAPLRNLCRARLLQAFLFRISGRAVKLRNPDFRRRMFFRLTSGGRAVAVLTREHETMEPMPTLNHYVNTGKWEVVEIAPRCRYCVPP
jgi:hypothetical protein